MRITFIGSIFQIDGSPGAIAILLTMHARGIHFSRLQRCPNHFNTFQEDTFPPEGNGCGDVCECEGNFDDDEDQDGSDAATFKIDFGRSTFSNPCEAGNTCNGDFDVVNK